MLYLIGLGLYDENDVTLKGIKVAKQCDRAYAELYTSPWRGSLRALEERIKKKIITLQRSDLEEKSRKLINEAKKSDIALFVPGDPLVATTHSSLITEARGEGIHVEIVHASSVLSAIGETGLHIYKFGKTATIAYPEDNFYPKTPYNILAENLEHNAHTLFLLDVKSETDLYMTVNEAVEILLDLEVREHRGIFRRDTKCLGVARLGGDALIKYGTAEELRKYRFGIPPHILIVPATLHFSEEEFLKNL